MRSTRRWTGMGFVLALAALAGCAGGGSERSDRPNEVVLKSYAVPEGYDPAELRSVVRSSLGENGGQVVVFPDGSLGVTAPRSVQEGIDALIRSLQARGPRPPEPAPATVAVDYWMLAARPLPAGRPAVGFTPAAQREAEALRPVLEEIVAHQGPMEFHLVERLRLTSLEGNVSAEIRGRNVGVYQSIASVPAGGHVADSRIRVFGKFGDVHQIQSRIALEPGRFVVLGQAAFNDNGLEPGAVPDPWRGNADLMLFCVVSEQATK